MQVNDPLGAASGALQTCAIRDSAGPVIRGLDEIYDTAFSYAV